MALFKQVTIVGLGFVADVDEDLLGADRDDLALAELALGDLAQALDVELGPGRSTLPGADVLVRI